MTAAGLLIIGVLILWLIFDPLHPPAPPEN